MIIGDAFGRVNQRVLRHVRRKGGELVEMEHSSPSQDSVFRHILQSYNKVLLRSLVESSVIGWDARTRGFGMISLLGNPLTCPFPVHTTRK